MGLAVQRAPQVSQVPQALTNEAGLAGRHGHDAQLMAHELGHFLFGLEDYYSDQDQRGDDNLHIFSGTRVG
ncbi:MAG: hypothetical protein SFV15_15415 [Polyangiaceae bacterium]|nr:hypothetical protein [Polyangiaceae bacterium]